MKGSELLSQKSELRIRILYDAGNVITDKNLEKTTLLTTTSDLI